MITIPCSQNTIHQLHQHNRETDQDSFRQHAVILRSELRSNENKFADKLNSSLTHCCRLIQEPAMNTDLHVGLHTNVIHHTQCKHRTSCAAFDHQQQTSPTHQPSLLESLQGQQAQFFHNSSNRIIVTSGWKHTSIRTFEITTGLLQAEVVPIMKWMDMFYIHVKAWL